MAALAKNQFLDIRNEKCTGKKNLSHIYDFNVYVFYAYNVYVSNVYDLYAYDVYAYDIYVQGVSKKIVQFGKCQTRTVINLIILSL